MDNLKFCFVKQKVWHGAEEYECWPQNSYLNAPICLFLTKDRREGQTHIPGNDLASAGKNLRKTHYPTRFPVLFIAANNRAPLTKQLVLMG